MVDWRLLGISAGWVLVFLLWLLGGCNRIGVLCQVIITNAAKIFLEGFTMPWSLLAFSVLAARRGMLMCLCEEIIGYDVCVKRRVWTSERSG